MLEVHGLVKRYAPSRRGQQAVQAVDGISFTVARGSFFTIVGPSGCGKTTTLRSIAGLEVPDGGRIRLDDKVLFCAEDGISVPPNERGLGMVFQSYAVWPHMDVFGNVAFPLTAVPRRERRTRSEIQARVERALAAVRLEDLAGRPATDLSSGQQQRVALARALVTEPPLLLLDEPLSNIDAKLREEMRAELLRLQRDFGVTTVYVTHDQVEALALSDAMAVMHAGRVEQVGRPRDVYDSPASAFVADFIGSANVVRGTVSSASAGTAVIGTDAGALTVEAAGLRSGQPVLVVVRAERLGVAEKDGSGVPPDGHVAWAGTVIDTAFLGDMVDHRVAVGPVVLRVRTDVGTTLAPGTEVVVHVPMPGCQVFPTG